MIAVTGTPPTRLTDRLLAGFFRQTPLYNEQTSNGFVELPSALPITGDQQTTFDYGMMALETAVAANNLSAFVQAYENIHWQERPAQSFVQAIHFALQIEAPLIARQLADTALALYPDHAEIQKIARILAPPKVTIMTADTTIDLVANRNWLNQHREQYKGQWVALQNGTLLAQAATRDAVKKQIGELKNSGVLLTKVY